VVAVMAILGIWICQASSRDLGVHDHPGIVWDEIVGYLITMATAPAGWLWVVLGFVLFRFFDILKPWPISWADKRVHGGLGIMLDDVLAAVYAWLVLHLIIGFFY
jgi:phosphatidylglycerophosphatase A